MSSMSASEGSVNTILIRHGISRAHFQAFVSSRTNPSARPRGRDLFLSVPPRSYNIPHLLRVRFRAPVLQALPAPPPATVLPASIILGVLRSCEQDYHAYLTRTTPLPATL